MHQLDSRVPRLNFVDLPQETYQVRYKILLHIITVVYRNRSKIDTAYRGVPEIKSSNLGVPICHPAAVNVSSSILAMVLLLGLFSGLYSAEI